jgi:hypothetical protein
MGVMGEPETMSFSVQANHAYFIVVEGYVGGASPMSTGTSSFSLALTCP